MCKSESNRRLLRSALPNLAPGYGDSAHDKAADRLARDMETRYEIRADNPDPAKAEEWAVFAITPNCHDRRVAYTTDKAEAEAVLLGLRAAPCMFAALEECITDDNACCMNTGQRERRLKAIDAIARAALARARGQEGGGE